MNLHPDIAIEVEGLTKSFNGRVVVRNLSMRVKRGQICGFLGPNGSGKTTTMRMLSGLVAPDEGRGTCLGHNVRNPARGEMKRLIGYMTQRFSLYQDLTIRENLEFVARIYGVRDPAGAARAMIRRMGLVGREQQVAGTLSGGWKQRLALGACMLPNPRLLLLDEPTAESIPRPAASSGTRSTRWPLTASPCWSRPTTWMRPSVAMRSPISPLVTSSPGEPLTT